MSLTLGVKLMITVVVIVATGCITRGPDYDTGKTFSDLRSLADMVVALFRNNLNLTNCQSVEDMLAAAQEARIIGKADAEYEWHKKDQWCKPFRWEARHQSGETIVRILSDGRDGITQDGKGDDLVVEIRSRAGGDPEISIKPINRK